MDWLFWAPLVAAIFHIIEEFLFPGGFIDWYTHYKPEIKQSISKRFLILINAGLLILCYDIGALGQSQFGIIAWLVIMALLGANGIWHLSGALKTRTYSPGVVTGILFYLPLSVYGYLYFILTNQVSIFIAFFALIIGSSYQLWSNLYHRFRSKSMVP